MVWTKRALREYAAPGMDTEAGHAALNLGLLHEWYDMWGLWKRPFEKIVRCFQGAEHCRLVISRFTTRLRLPTERYRLVPLIPWFTGPASLATAFAR